MVVTGSLRLLRTQGRTVHVVAVGLVGRAKADNGLDLDKRMLVSAGLGLCDGLPDGAHIPVAILNSQHLPAVSLVAFAHILGEGQLRVSINGDVVIIVEGDELAKAEVATVLNVAVDISIEGDEERD